MKPYRPWVRIALVIALAGAVAWAVSNRAQFDLTTVEQRVQSVGVWAPAAYIVFYILATVIFLPGSILSLAGGALFGPLWGTLYTLTGATIGAAFAFLIARYVASDWVRAKVGPRLARVIAGVEEEGWRFVAFTRLVPLFPFNLLNYALGLTRVRFLPYLVSSFLCMIPGALAYTYLGYAGREAAAGSTAVVQKGFVALGLLAAIVFLPRLIRHARQGTSDWIDPVDLQVRLASGAPPIVLDVRGPEEYRGPLGHLKDSRNIPVSELPRRMAELESLKNSEWVLVCKTQMRSLQGAALLRESGFRHVAVLRGGMAEWENRGLPTEFR